MIMLWKKKIKYPACSRDQDIKCSQYQGKKCSQEQNVGNVVTV